MVMAPNFMRVKVFGRSRSSIQPPQPLNTEPEPARDLESGSFLPESQRQSATPEISQSNNGDNPYLDEYRG